MDGEGEDGGDADEVADGGEVGGEVVGLEEGDGDGGGEGAFEHEFEAWVGDAGFGPEGFAALCERGFGLRRAIELLVESLDSLLDCWRGWPSVGGPAFMLALALALTASFRWSCNGGGII